MFEKRLKNTSPANSTVSAGFWSARQDPKDIILIKTAPVLDAAKHISNSRLEQLLC